MIHTKSRINDFVIDPAGSYAYSAEITHCSEDGLHCKGYVVEYAVKHNGSLQKIGRTASIRDFGGLAIDPKDRFIYLSSNEGHNRVAAYRIKHDGRPLLIAKGFPGIYSVNNMAMDPAGKHLYLSDDISILDMYPPNSQWEKTSVYTSATIQPNGMISVMGVCAIGAGHGPSSAATTPY